MLLVVVSVIVTVVVVSVVVVTEITYNVLVVDSNIGSSSRTRIINISAYTNKVMKYLSSNSIGIINTRTTIGSYHHKHQYYHNNNIILKLKNDNDNDNDYFKTRDYESLGLLN